MDPLLRRSHPRRVHHFEHTGQTPAPSAVVLAVAVWEGGGEAGGSAVVIMCHCSQTNTTQ